MSFVMILQLLVVLGALWVGSRYGSLALGAISGIGLAILVFGFGLKPRHSSNRRHLHHHCSRNLCGYHAGFGRNGLAHSVGGKDAA